MERVKTIAWWIAAFLFLSCALASFPSFGCLLFLIGAAVSVPLPTVRGFLSEKGLRGVSKVMLVVALLIAGSLAAPDSLKERGAEKETPSAAQEVAETAQAVADSENIPEDEETPLEPKETPSEAVEVVETAQAVADSENVLEDEETPPEPEEVTESKPVNEPEPVEEKTELEVIEEPHDPLDDLDTESVEYDALQKLYVTFPRGVSFQEAVEFLDASGLPYSSVKYNGSRAFQVSTEEAGTAQKYNKSGLSYVKIDYRYPKNRTVRMTCWKNTRSVESNMFQTKVISHLREMALFAALGVILQLGGTSHEKSKSRFSTSTKATRQRLSRNPSFSNKERHQTGRGEIRAFEFCPCFSMPRRFLSCRSRTPRR